MRRALAAAAVLVATAAPAAEFDAATGYRIDRYRAPIDRPVEGGAVASLADVDRLVRDEGAALIDVMPARAGFDPDSGAWRLVEERRNIPGSIWLPEVGRGTLEPRIAAYFAASLARIAGGRPDRPLIFYCMADCWMSWNAVKRAASLGHARLYWFSEGTDGWSEAGRPLVPGEPWPAPPLAGAGAGVKEHR